MFIFLGEIFADCFNIERRCIGKFYSANKTKLTVSPWTKRLRNRYRNICRIRVAYIRALPRRRSATYSAVTLASKTSNNAQLVENLFPVTPQLFSQISRLYLKNSIEKKAVPNLEITLKSRRSSDTQFIALLTFLPHLGKLVCLRLCLFVRNPEKRFRFTSLEPISLPYS